MSTKEVRDSHQSVASPVLAAKAITRVNISGTHSLLWLSANDDDDNNTFGSECI